MDSSRFIGRGRGFGSDDFCCPSLSFAAVRLTWICFAAGVCVYIYIQPGCHEKTVPTILSISIMLFLVLQMCILLCDLALVFISTRGSILDPHPRSKIVYFIYVRLVFYLGEIGWAVYSMIVVVHKNVTERLSCDAFQNAVLAYTVLVVLQWLILAITGVVYTVMMDPCGCCCVSGLIKRLHRRSKRKLPRTHTARDETDGRSDIDSSGGMAEARRLAMVDLHAALHSFWNDDDDSDARGKQTPRGHDAIDGDAEAKPTHVFTDTDKITGLFLIFQYQKLIKWNTHKILKARDYKSEDICQELSSETELPVKLFNYLWFALAAYGWPMQMWLDPCKALPFCFGVRCCCCACCSRQLFVQDCCFPNECSIKWIVESHVKDFSNLNVEVGIQGDSTPFYVCTCTENGKKTVVIAIRGTLTPKDILADISMSTIQPEDPEFLQQDSKFLGIPSKNCSIHKGFYQGARHIFRDHLHKMQNAVEQPIDYLREYVVKPNEQQIVIVGHSLGAGVAAVLAMFLKSKYPKCNLKAYLFGPPGCVCNSQLADKSKKFITSVIGGYDMVSRMSMLSLKYLKMDILELLQSDKVDVPKHKILCCCERVHKPARRIVEPDGPIEETDGPTDETDGLDARIKKVKQQVNANATKVNRMRQRPVLSQEHFIPGKILHIEKDKKSVRATWKSREEFSVLLIHPGRMFCDHGPRSTLHFVKTLKERYGPRTN